MPLPVLAVWAIGTAIAGGATAGGSGVAKIRSAKRLVEEKQEQLEAAETAMRHHREACEAAFASLGEAKIHAISTALLPFHDAFSKLKHVDLTVAVREDGVPSVDVIRVHEAARLTVDIASALGVTAVGAGAGALASSGTTSAVGYLASASTGTAIRGLSGAAAKKATLAWLGGGSLASGGGGVATGTAVLAGIAAAPVVLVGGIFLHHKGREALAKAELFEGDVDTAVAKHRQAVAVLHGARQQAALVGRQLDRLTPTVAEGSGWLATVVEQEPDWRSLDAGTQDAIRRLVAMAMATSALVHTPLMSDDGVLTPAIREAVHQGRTVLG